MLTFLHLAFTGNSRIRIGQYGQPLNDKPGIPSYIKAYDILVETNQSYQDEQVVSCRKNDLLLLDSPGRARVASLKAGINSSMLSFGSD